MNLPPGSLRFLFGRLALAGTWLYHGLWAKLLGGDPGHLEIVESVPFLTPDAALGSVRALGLVEVALAGWVLSGRRPGLAAGVQTSLLALMNGGGLIWAAGSIPDPAAMIVANLSLLALIWIVALGGSHHAGV